MLVAAAAIGTTPLNPKTAPDLSAMQCAVKNRRCSSLDNVEQQQQSLFDVSIFKLQHEQMRHGVDPRLLRFVLINNALRSLQGHMIHFDNDECEGDGGGRCGGGGGEGSDMFFYNTFKNGSLFSIPLSPPTPVKTLKADSAFSDQSPLVEFQEASSPCSPGMENDNMFTSLGEERVQPAARLDEIECEVAGEDGGGYVVEGGMGKERRSLNTLTDMHGFGVHLGKRSRDKFVEELTLEGHKDDSAGHLLDSSGIGVGGGKEGTLLVGEADSKRPCKSPGLQKVVNGLNGLNNLYVALELDPLPPPILPSSPTSLTPPHYHQYTQSLTTEESDKDSLTPSPIDFANVDPSIYDFDTAVLTVDSAEGGELDTHSPHLLPSHITITASTSFSSTHTSSHLATSSFPPSSASSSSSASCSPESCPLSGTAPLLFPSLPCSSMALQSSQLNHTENNSDFSAMNKPHSEAEKMSLLSADSTVMTAVPGGSPTMITATTKGASCSMEALVHNGELGLGAGEELTADTRDSINNGNRGALPSSPVPGIELDCTLDDIDHIVNLLMT